MAELTRELGEQGVWVEQVTTWDPHPVDGVKEPFLFNYDFGDPAMASWANVVFWDNYWRTQGNFSLDFTGEPVDNAWNLQLSEAALSNGGYGNEHSDAHLWYHGTVDLSEDPPANDGSEDVPNGWYGATHPARSESGSPAGASSSGVASGDSVGGSGSCPIGSPCRVGSAAAEGRRWR